MIENQPATAATVDNAHHQTRTSSGWLWCLGAVVVALLLLAAVATLFSSKPLQISHDTTYITTPLTADAKRVDYFAAIEQATRPANAATDQNGYRLLVQHLGRDPEMDVEHFRAVCAQLGLDADAIQPDVTFQEPYDFLRAYVAGNKFDQTLLDRLPGDSKKMDPARALASRLDQPWTLDDLPMMAPWLDANGPALDLIGRAVREPEYYIPVVRRSEEQLLLAMLLPAIQRARSFGRALSARAYHRIAIGDIDGAIDDIITCIRLGRSIGRGPTIVDMLVGIAIEGIAGAIGIASSLEHPPAAEQIRRLVKELENLPPEYDLDQKQLFERFAALDAIQLLALGQDAWLPDDLPSPARHLLSRTVDWNVVAKRFNEHFDAMAATGAAPAPLALSPRLVISARARSEHAADMLGWLLIPAWDAAREATSRTRCNQQVRRITLAMLLYERDHGTLPPAWTVDADGHPLHSWRVLLLPYLGQQALYDGIRLDEPWDSQHNQQFHGEDLAIYRCPSAPAAQPGQTTYSVVVGAEMPFEAGEGKRLADFGPHSNDMILLVERAPIGWMEPARETLQSAVERDIHGHYGRSAPAPGHTIASHHPNGAMFGLRNGAARFLSLTRDAEAFNQMLRGTHENRYRW